MSHESTGNSAQFAPGFHPSLLLVQLMLESCFPWSRACVGQLVCIHHHLLVRPDLEQGYRLCY